VREALSALEILGITERRVGKGNFIKIKDTLNPLYDYDKDIIELEQEESPFELMEARKVLEVEVAGLASQKALQGDVSKIEAELNKMREALENIPKMMEMDRRFHISVARAAHNNFLFSMMLNMSNLLKERLWVNMKEKTWSLPGYPQKYLKEHSAILEAIKSKDSKASRKAMHFHLVGVEKDMLK
jgi:DNA-binding FadR family transcriptional regulator